MLTSINKKTLADKARAGRKDIEETFVNETQHGSGAIERSVECVQNIMLSRMKHEYVLPDKFLWQIFVAKIRRESVNFYLAVLNALK